MSNIERRLAANASEIISINKDGMSKSTLQNILNSTGVPDSGTPEDNFFSITNLVTGRCDDEYGCPTVDTRLTDQKTKLDRLTTLVSSNEKDAVKFVDRMNTFGIYKDVAQGNMSFESGDGSMYYDLHAKGLTLDENLTVGKKITTSNLIATTATIQNDLTVNTNAYMKNATIQPNGYLNVPDFENIRTTTETMENKSLPSYLKDNYVRQVDDHLTNARLTSNNNSRILTIQNQANEDIEVIIPIVSTEVQQSATDLGRLKTSPIIDVIKENNNELSRRMDFYSNLDSSTTVTTGYIPNKWSFIKSNNDGDWVYQTGDYDGVLTPESPLPFHKDRSDVIEALRTPVDDDTEIIKIKLGKEVVIGNICLKSTKLPNQGDDVLAVCDSECDNCTPVWTHNQAPVPK
jgi:hypothetical protein